MKKQNLSMFLCCFLINMTLLCSESTGEKQNETSEIKEQQQRRGVRALLNIDAMQEEGFEAGPTEPSHRHWQRKDQWHEYTVGVSRSALQSPRGVISQEQKVNNLGSFVARLNLFNKDEKK